MAITDQQFLKLSDKVVDIEAEFRKFQSSNNIEQSKIVSSVKSDLSETEIRLTDKYSELKDSVKNDLSETEIRLTDKYSELKDSVKNDLSETENRLMDKYLELKHSVKNDLSDTEIRLMGKYSELKDSVKNDLSETENRLMGKYSELKGEVVKLDGKVDSLSNKIDTSQDKLVIRVGRMLFGAVVLLSAVITIAAFFLNSNGSINTSPASASMEQPINQEVLMQSIVKALRQEGLLKENKAPFQKPSNP